MDVRFKSSKLAKLCNSQKERERAWGERRAKIAGRRLDDLRAAGTLGDMRQVPGDCHEYKHRDDCVFTLDLDGAWRLFFRPSHDPLPLLPDCESVDWTKITEIEITDVRKAHE